MKFFPEKTKKDPPLIKILRFLALISIFIIAGSLFWKNNQKAMHTVSGKMAIWDQSNVRELEGALNILITRQQLSKAEISEEDVYSCLKTLGYYSL